MERRAGDTLTAVELDRGEELRFVLRNGEVRTLVLQETAARILLTNLPEVGKSRPGTQTLYHFTCRVLVDGHPLTLERYVASQESFYEPYVINGVRLWFDGVRDVFTFLREVHGECQPRKAARFALCDARDRICPEEVHAWHTNPAGFIGVGGNYNGDDCWMGAYNGVDAHGGLDVNMPRRTPNFAPIAMDDHYLFDTLAGGDNNNRWRGIRRWPNGDTWVLQNHHITNLLVPEHTPIRAGALYQEAAGVHSGNHHHSHYVFKVQHPGDDGEILLDAWILFWQAFEDQKRRSGAIRAAMAPLSPARTGDAVAFSSEGSRGGPAGERLTYTWTFGDGGWSDEAELAHAFAAPGIYPVTLTVDDGAELATCTQLLTVDGPPVAQPALGLAAPDEFAFRPRPAHAADVYGAPVRDLPHTLVFTARASWPEPAPRGIHLCNTGDGVLPEATVRVRCEAGEGWLRVERVGEGNVQGLRVSVDATGMPAGRYQGMVEVVCPGALNERQGFRVRLDVPTGPPMHAEMGNARQVVVDDQDVGFYATPWFWVGPRFCKWAEKGHGGFYLTNGGRAVEGEFARFTPDLAAGCYTLSLSQATPFEPERRARVVGAEDLPVNRELNPSARFAVRVVHRKGDDIVWMEPAVSRLIGAFEFDEGTDGFVEILAGGSRGQVLADAVVWKLESGE